jgi:small subunit ribosomal protein S6
VNNYELTVILRVSDALESNKEKVKSILQKYGVSVASEDQWGVRRLAYMIRTEKDGFYTLFTLEAQPDAIQKITSEFRLNIDILRFLFVRLKKKKTA